MKKIDLDALIASEPVLQAFLDAFSGTFSNYRTWEQYETEPEGIFITSDITENGRRLLRRLGRDSSINTGNGGSAAKRKNLLLSVLEICRDTKPVFIADIKNELQKRGYRTSDILLVIYIALEEGLLTDCLQVTETGLEAIKHRRPRKLPESLPETVVDTEKLPTYEWHEEGPYQPVKCSNLSCQRYSVIPMTNCDLCGADMLPYGGSASNWSVQEES